MEENQQIDLVKTQVSKAQDAVGSIVIKTADDYTAAVELGGKLKQVSKMLIERKEEMTGPLNSSLRSIRALFKPMEDDFEKAERGLKQKMLDFKAMERQKEIDGQKKIDEDIAIVREKSKSGEMNSYEADQAIGASFKENTPILTEKTVRGATGAKATEKFITEYVVTDISLIPLNFLDPNMVKIKASFKAGLPVPGVEEQKKASMSF